MSAQFERAHAIAIPPHITINGSYNWWKSLWTFRKFKCKCVSLFVCAFAFDDNLYVYLCLHISHRPYFIVWNYSEIIINIEFIDVCLMRCLCVQHTGYHHLPFMCDTNHSILKASIGSPCGRCKRTTINIRHIRDSKMIELNRQIVAIKCHRIFFVWSISSD